ncbi:WD40 repeat-like protein [Microthyrium microscopicum]|uniref:WD40 repeat-like protein n=1 Tax=Microthyrium microscopicum TaxID=703497 RepID=A0A6A6USM4_9PEZI|nr:WD40 repeat-like protein [Microthyrium microscopicum]
MSMITATGWVPRGFAAAFPTKYVFDDDEYGRIAKLAKLQLEDAEEDLEEAKEAAEDINGESSEHDGNGATGEVNGESSKSNGNGAKASSKKSKDKEEADDDLKEYDLEHYDDDGDEENGPGTSMDMFGNFKSLAYHESNEEDPYITLDADEEDDEEREELQIFPTDNMLLAARIEDDIAHLEVYVYEDDADNLYVHHDIMLPAYPLCVEWLNSAAGKGAAERSKEAKEANFVAIGTMNPDIEIWDLDMIDCMYPNAILGQGGDPSAGDGEPKKKKKKKKSRKPNDKYHVDAVLSLAGNKQHKNLLASSSADMTVKLWDLHSTTSHCAKSYELHQDKVCSIAWNQYESTVLLTGSYDRTATVSDMRAPGTKVPRWTVESDVETVKWDPHNAANFYVSTESGIIHCFDVRQTPSEGQSKALWTLQAHDESISSFDVNPIIPGYLVTGSTDKSVKLWNVVDNRPSMVVSRNLDVGKVFSTTWAPDKEVGFRLAVAGSKGSVQIWDTSTNAAVRRIFADRVAPADGEEVKERLIGVEESEDDSDEDEEEDEDDAEGGEDEDDDDDEMEE